MCSAGTPSARSSASSAWPGCTGAVVIAVQVDEQHPAAEPARLTGGVRRLRPPAPSCPPRPAPPPPTPPPPPPSPAGSSSPATCASSAVPAGEPRRHGGSCASATGAAVPSGQHRAGPGGSGPRQEHALQGADPAGGSRHRSAGTPAGTTAPREHRGLRSPAAGQRSAARPSPSPGTPARARGDCPGAAVRPVSSRAASCAAIPASSASSTVCISRQRRARHEPGSVNTPLTTLASVPGPLFILWRTARRRCAATAGVAAARSARSCSVPTTIAVQLLAARVCQRPDHPRAKVVSDEHHACQCPSRYPLWHRTTRRHLGAASAIGRC